MLLQAEAAVRSHRSRLSRGDDLADAAFGASRKKGHDVLAHPWTAHLPRNAIRVLLGGELQDKDQVTLVDLDDAGGKPARRHDTLNDLRQSLDG